MTAVAPASPAAHEAVLIALTQCPSLPARPSSLGPFIPAAAATRDAAAAVTPLLKEKP